MKCWKGYRRTGTLMHLMLPLIWYFVSLQLKTLIIQWQRLGTWENKIDEKHRFERDQHLNDKVIIIYNSFLIT